MPLGASRENSVTEKKELPPPLFLARQPILQISDWHELLQKNEAGEMTQNMAQAGQQQAALHWGRMLLTGQGTKQDMKAAFICFQQTAEQEKSKDRSAALNMMGRCYQYGWGIAADLDKAFFCYIQAAEAGDPWALFNLADCYRKGVGCIADASRAAEFYTKAAAHGHVKSLNMLGLCYEEGNGVARDEARAAQLFAEGAQKGDCWASFNHARLLAAKGERDESLYWLERSLEQQSGDYCQTFANLFAASKDEKLQGLVAKAQEMAQEMAQERQAVP